jgi:signal transduction histidine kinase
VVLLFSGALWWSAAPAQWEQARALFWIDLSFGAAALVLTFYRRRWPFAVAVVTSALGAVSVTANGPGALATVSMATRRVTSQIVLVGLVSLVPSLTIPMLAPNRADDPLWIDFVLGALTTVALLVGGMYIGSRRELLWTLRDRADRAEAEQSLRVEQGRLNERTRIAREMHDVLAHRISLISMHAGALAYRTDLTAEQVHETAELLQAKAHEALADLRQVLGVLRDGRVGGADDPSERPQPTFADLSALVLEAEGVGMRIQYDDRVLDADQMPERVGRTAYRIVQEGLTNVRKHAPGVTALVQVTGSPADGVSVRVSNPTRSPAAGNGTRVSGAGLGIVGLTERAKLAGGTLTARRESGSFELTGWLPWTR